MSTTPAAAANGLPPIPDEPVQEGARWRFHRPSSQAVASWFDTVPIDDGLAAKDFVGGVVLIPQTEKVKHTTQDGTRERHEQVFTPYVQIGTRVFYARKLALSLGAVYKPRPLQVPRIDDRQSVYYNGNMPPGLWWHVVMNVDGQAVKYLCSTWRVEIVKDGQTLIEGQGTKQVTGLNYGGLDENALMKAETGAIGRALGVAGILTVGTGIATAEDMQEFSSSSATQATAPSLPPTEVPQGAAPSASSPQEELAQLRSRYLAAQTRVQELGAWGEYLPWFKERKASEGWGELDDVPPDGLRAMIAKLDQIKGLAESAEVIS